MSPEKLLQLGTRLNDPFKILPFQPILYFFLFSAMLRLLTDNNIEPPNFKGRFSENFYGIWLLLGISSPLLALLSYLFIKKLNKNCSFLGLWIGLAGDIGVFTVLITYHIATIEAQAVKTEVTVFNRYVFGSVILYSLVLIFKDLLTILIIEKLATQVKSIRE